MSVLLISKSEGLYSKALYGVHYCFAVCMALCNVYYNFHNCIYIAVFLILYAKGYLFLSKNDCATLVDIKIPVCLKRMCNFALSSY